VSWLDRFKKERTPPELDQLSLKHLRFSKADLTLPRHIVHYVYFQEESDARAAGEVVADAGYDVTVSPADTVSQWLIRAEITRVVDETTVPGYRRWFEQIADRHGGEYDGWEAATKP
jgi:hypothetical protein